MKSTYKAFLPLSYVFLFLPLLFLFSSCGGRSGEVVSVSENKGVGSLGITLKWPGQNGKFSMPAGVVTIRIVVSASDMTTVTKDFPASAGGGTMSSVAAGTGRTVAASALDGSGNTLYSGSASNITVTADQTTDVAIVLIAGTKSSDVTQIAGRGSFTCVLSPKGVQCWGNIYSFQNNIIPSAFVVDSNSSIISASAISAGGSHACALVSTGDVKCWGDNSYGQLGDKTTTSRPYAAEVFGISTAKAISLGGNHSCALLNNGSIQCWGYNSYGQLGDGTTTGKSQPIPVLLPSNDATAIALGSRFSCALRSDKTVWCWGYNGSNQLGGGATSYSSSSPVQVANLTGVALISAGGSHACALLSTGDVKCWGDNSYGQLGNGSTYGGAMAIPQTVSGLSGTPVAITAGGSHTCARLSTGAVQCWGSNYSGQLGNNSTTDSSVPVTVDNLADATLVSGGDLHTCALSTSSTSKGPVCWGDNSYGQLGNGGKDNSSVPVSVVFP